jgi:Phage tail protein (Tail_P2_I)
MTVQSIANVWPAQLEPIMTPDLADYVAAIASMWAQCDAFLEDPDNEVVAWQPLFDVDLAPTWVLPWLAQCVGERLPVGYDDEQSRDWIRNSPTWIRGTPQGIWNAVQRVLAPGASMQMRERWNANVAAVDSDWISIFTWSEETPDENLVSQALRRNVPADVLVYYATQPSPTWAGVLAAAPTWAAVQADYGPTWADVRGATSGFTTWT